MSDALGLSAGGSTSRPGLCQVGEAGRPQQRVSSRWTDGLTGSLARSPPLPTGWKCPAVMAQSLQRMGRAMGCTS